MRVRLFWLCAAVVGYTYVVFPLVVLARGRARAETAREVDTCPTVSIVIAARNEEEAIGPRLENLLTLDYPPEACEVIVASDGSDDATNAVVAGFDARGVRLLRCPREGKAAALNAAVQASKNDILVFTDANSMFEPQSLRALVAPFADGRVGAVAGDQRYAEGDQASGTAVGERGYWDFDRALKDAESTAGSVVSATGAIYAIRRELVDSVPAGVTDDFFVSTGAVAAGYRLVFAPDAVAVEPVAESSGLEFARKVRVMTRGLRAVMARRALLDARRHGFYSVQLFSHKVLRRLVAVPLVGLAVTTPRLWRRGALYRAAAVAQAGVYGLGAAGIVLRNRKAGRKRVLALPAFFCLANAAALVALRNLVTGRVVDRWEPERRAAEQPDEKQA